MHSTHRTIAVAAVASLIGSVASADFQGISWEVIDADGLSGSLPGSFPVQGLTWRIYADVDEGGQVDMVYGDGVSGLNVGTTGHGDGSSPPGFYQHIFGSHTSAGIPADLLGLYPSLAYDSFVTIGRLNDFDNATLDLGIDWTNFELGGDISADNGSWFATPDDDQVFGQPHSVDGSNYGAGDTANGVLIGQFTTVDDNPNGTFNLVGRDSSNTSWIIHGANYPAPGVLALLGIAAWGVCRRRPC